MATTGIEHREPATVLQAFDFFEMPNFAIYAGSEQRTAYEGDNFDQAREKLEEFLEMIEASKTSSVYTLKVYPSGTKNITKKTPASGSTTFMLNPDRAVTRGENGVVMISQPGQKQVGESFNNPMYQMLMQRLDKQETANEKLRGEMFALQLKL